MLEPITLPITIPFVLLNDALMLTAASGALVPKATIVSPITMLGILNLFAKKRLTKTFYYAKIN